MPMPMPPVYQAPVASALKPRPPTPSKPPSHTDSHAPPETGGHHGGRNGRQYTIAGEAL